MKIENQTKKSKWQKDNLQKVAKFRRFNDLCFEKISFYRKSIKILHKPEEREAIGV